LTEMVFLARLFCPYVYVRMLVRLCVYTYICLFIHLFVCMHTNEKSGKMVWTQTPSRVGAPVSSTH
jgi:hypothetical protein